MEDRVHLDAMQRAKQPPAGQAPAAVVIYTEVPGIPQTVTIIEQETQNQQQFTIRPEDAISAADII